MWKKITTNNDNIIRLTWQCPWKDSWFIHNLPAIFVELSKKKYLAHASPTTSVDFSSTMCRLALSAAAAAVSPAPSATLPSRGSSASASSPPSPALSWECACSRCSSSSRPSSSWPSWCERENSREVSTRRKLKQENLSTEVVTAIWLKWHGGIYSDKNLFFYALLVW